MSASHGKVACTDHNVYRQGQLQLITDWVESALALCSALCLACNSHASAQSDVNSHAGHKHTEIHQASLRYRVTLRCTKPPRHSESAIHTVLIGVVKRLKAPLRLTLHSATLSSIPMHR